MQSLNKTEPNIIGMPIALPSILRSPMKYFKNKSRIFLIKLAILSPLLILFPLKAQNTISDFAPITIGNKWTYEALSTNSYIGGKDKKTFIIIFKIINITNLFDSTKISFQYTVNGNLYHQDFNDTNWNGPYQYSQDTGFSCIEYKSSIKCDFISPLFQNHSIYDSNLTIDASLPINNHIYTENPLPPNSLFSQKKYRENIGLTFYYTVNERSQSYYSLKLIKFEPDSPESNIHLKNNIRRNAVSIQHFSVNGRNIFTNSNYLKLKYITTK